MSDQAVVRWPDLREEDRWVIDDFERYLEDTTRSPESLRARATELRKQAAATDIRGMRNALEALAAHYEEAAADRISSR